MMLTIKHVMNFSFLGCEIVSAFFYAWRFKGSTKGRFTNLE